VCHHFQENAIPLTAGKKAKGWKEFVAMNPGKVR
jgi:hypothetical protein